MSKFKRLTYLLAVACLGTVAACGRPVDSGANQELSESIRAAQSETVVAKAAADNSPAAGVNKAFSGANSDSDVSRIKRGKMLFVKATCWGCHPHGDNAVNGDKPLKGANFCRKYKTDAELAIVIRRGNEKAGMPPFPPGKLNEPDLKQIIFFVRSLSANHGQ